VETSPSSAHKLNRTASRLAPLGFGRAGALGAPNSNLRRLQSGDTVITLVGSRLVATPTTIVATPTIPKVIATAVADYDRAILLNPMFDTPQVKQRRSEKQWGPAHP